MGMGFASVRQDAVRSSTQRELLRHWLQACARDEAPLWRSLDAEQLVRLGDNLTFQDVVGSGDDVRFRILFHGKRIGEMYGAKCDGKFLDEILPEPLRAPALATYRHAVETRRPVYTVGEVQDRSGQCVRYERLLLPFRLEGAVIDRILASLETFGPNGAFDESELLKSQTAAPRMLLRASIEVE